MTSLHYETREYAGQFIDAWRHVSEIGIFSPPSFVLLPVRLPHRKILTRPSRAGEGDTSRHYRRGCPWFTRANLAFTFGLAAARFDTRRRVLLDEANVLGTIYLRAGMLPEKRDEIRTLLRNYADARIQAVRSGKNPPL